MVKFQIRSEGCRVGRVADSLFRPHPEQRARASRQPKYSTPMSAKGCDHERQGRDQERQGRDHELQDPRP